MALPPSTATACLFGLAARLADPYRLCTCAVAADDRLTPADYDTTWNEWANQMQPIAAEKAYMALPGNHEASCHSFGDFFCPDGLRNFSAYNARFRMPAQESGSGTNMWSSFDYGSAHFISIDTESDYPNAPEGVDTIWNAGTSCTARASCLGAPPKHCWARSPSLHCDAPEQVVSGTRLRGSRLTSPRQLPTARSGHGLLSVATGNALAATHTHTYTR